MSDDDDRDHEEEEEEEEEVDEDEEGGEDEDGDDDDDDEAVAEGVVIYGFGDNTEGQLNGAAATDTEDTFVTKPQKAEGVEHVTARAVFCGGTSSGCISDDNSLFLWGSAVAGDEERYPTNTIAPVSGLDNVVHANLGPLHRLAISDQGATKPVMSWGQGTYGKLGHGDWEFFDEPTTVDSLSHKMFKMVACGGNHSLALSYDGEVYSWGAGSCGQLGHDSQADQVIPKVVKGLLDYNIKFIAAGNDFSAAVSETGDLYTFGFNAAGQLGLGDSEDRLRPTQVDLPAAVKSVACGYYHMLALTTKGQVYSWGSGTGGKLGYGDCTSSSVPSQVHEFDGEKIVQVACGWNHSAAVTERGLLFTWGYGKKGRLGHGDENSKYIPTPVKGIPYKVIGVATGSAHTLLLVDETQRLRH